MSDTCTIWVCQSCMLHHANGECGSCHMNMDDPYRETDAHDREPMGLIDQPMSGREMATMGMLREEHDCDTRWSDWRERDCGCETRSFSWSSCEGCGSNLGGERHAFTVWFG